MKECDMKNNMKNVFLIISYCDTKLKVDVLNECIDNLRSISNNDICLHAHYPLNDNIQKKVNYYLYDASNPVLYYPEKYMLFWRNYKNFKMTISTEDYGYAALHQLKTGFNFLKKMYDNIIIINYDVHIENDIINMLNNSNDCELFYWENDILNISILSINSKIELNFNKNDYVLNINADAESFLDNYFNKNFNCNKHKHHEYKDYFFTKMSFDNILEKNNNYPILGNPFMIYNFILLYDDTFKVQLHCGNYNDKVAILFFNIKQPINIKINNINLDTTNKEYILYTLDINWYDLKAKDIEIYIDDYKIDDYIILSFIERNSKLIEL